MSYDYAPVRRPLGLADRILTLLGFSVKDKSSLCTDRMAALDDPATRKALAHLPSHLLRDIGVTAINTPDPRVEGEALRKHLW
ncbi:DUF1127 domain-containing protein [Paracoccus yeei]